MNRIMTKDELLKKNARIKAEREQKKAAAEVVAEPVCDECVIIETKKKRGGKKPSSREYMVVDPVINDDCAQPVEASCAEDTNTISGIEGVEEDLESVNNTVRAKEDV